MLAYTGLETVANLAEEAREPGRTLPRSLFSAIGLVVVLTVLDRDRRGDGVPGDGRVDRARRRVARGADRRHRDRVRAASCPRAIVDVLRVVVGLSGALDPLGGGDDVDLRLHPARALDGRARDAAARVRAARAAHPRLARGDRGDRDRRDRDRCSSRPRSTTRRVSSPSTYSFGVLLAFTAAQLAVIRLRAARAGPRTAVPGATRGADPGRRRPAAGARRGAAHLRRAGCSRSSRTRRPLRRARLARRRPRRLRDRRGRAARVGMLEDVDPRIALPTGVRYRQDPRADEARRHRRGDGRDGDRARQGARRDASRRSPSCGSRASCPLEAPLPADVARAAADSLAEARALGEENDVEVRRGRSPRALDRPRDRRRGRAAAGRPDRARLVAPLAPAVAVLLADRRPRAPHAPCEVLVVAFPEGVFEEA